MSVINQMLQELEQRQAGDVAPAAQVRAVRHRGGDGGARRALSMSVAVMFVAAAVGGVAYWLWGGPGEKNLALPAVSASVPSAPPRAETLPQVLQLAGELSQLPAPSGKSSPLMQSPVPAAPTEALAHKNDAPAPKPQPAEELASQPVAISKEIRQPGPQQRAESAYRQAYASLQQGRMGEAEEGLRQALQFDPRHAAARQALAALLVETKQLGRAEQLLQQGLEIQAGHAGFSMTLARLQVERGDVAAALATLQRSPPSGAGAEYHGFMAALLQRAERHKEAIEHFQSALHSNPDSGPWLLGLGISLQADNQPGRAAEAFRRARSSGGLSPELQAFADQRLKQVQ